MKRVSYETFDEALVMAIPELADRLAQEREWWVEEKPAPHVIVGDILTPYVLQSQSTGDEAALSRALKFLEELALSDDVRVQELAAFSFLERLLADSPEHVQLKRRLPDVLRQLLKEVERFHQAGRERPNGS